MSQPITPSSMPTISELYKTSILHPASGGDVLYPASASLNSKVSLIRHDITKLATTCIVNAANTSLLGGGGVDGAIHSAAGRTLLHECRTLNGCPTGFAKITSAHALPSQYIIHAVGPVYSSANSQRPGSAEELLAGCYRWSLELAAQRGGSLAFSCLSTGIYRYPSQEAARVACEIVREFLEYQEEEIMEEQRLERVVFCCFLEKDEKAYGEWLPKVFPPTEDELLAAQKHEEEQKVVEPHSAAKEGAVHVPDGEPHAKKAKTDESGLGTDDWEAVETPSETASDRTTEINEEGIRVETPTEMSEEGVKVEKPELAESDGEKIEKPTSEVGEDGEGPLKHGLLKDW